MRAKLKPGAVGGDRASGCVQSGQTAHSLHNADDTCPQCRHATETFRRVRTIRSAIDDTVASTRAAYEFAPGSYTFGALNAALNVRRLVRLFGLDGDDEVSP
jgi:hypothetical protein